jgi:hypothetical protein
MGYQLLEDFDQYATDCLDHIGAPYDGETVSPSDGVR